MKVAVECSRDARGTDVPTRLKFDGRTVTVADVIDRWPGRGYCYFKLKGDDGALYVIRHDEAVAGWELTQFRRGKTSAPTDTSVAGSV